MMDWLLGSLVQFLLWLLGEHFILRLRLEPEAEGNGDGRQTHDDECDPVKKMGRELLVELGQVDDATFTGL